jgi:phenylalanyl-tRNA synthetase beta chain
MVVAGEVPTSDRVIDFPWSETKRLTGLAVTPPEQKHTLQKLGFWVSGSGDHVKVAPPSWRPDVEGKADIVEEVIRIVGLDRVRPEPFPPQQQVNGPVLTLLQRRTRAAKRLLASLGLVEAVTYSFVSRAQAEAFGGGRPELALSNPIASDLSDMRPSLLPGLMAAAQRNIDRGFGDLALFEVGQVYESDRDEGQLIAAAAVRCGLSGSAGVGRHWRAPAAAAEAQDARADLIALLQALGVQTAGLQVVPANLPFLHPGRSGRVQFGPQNVIGWFGEIHPRTLEALGVAGPVVAFEVMLDKIPAPKARPTKMKPKLALSEFQPVRRDFAFLVDAGVAAEDILRIARGIDRALVSNVTLFDVYTGKGIDPGKKSLGIELTLQPSERTLTEADIEGLSTRFVGEVTKKTGATLRG